MLVCANNRATYSLRGVPPAETEQFAAAHDSAAWLCFTQLLGISGHAEEAHEWASLPFQMGGCGLRSATRTRVPAHWVSWADSLRMIHSRHPDQVFVWSNTQMRHFSAAASCHADLRVRGYFTPEWEDLPTLCLVHWPTLPWFLSIVSRTLWWSLAPLLPSGLRSARKVALCLAFHHSALHLAPPSSPTVLSWHASERWRQSASQCVLA